jgi:hypothetical protein
MAEEYRLTNAALIEILQATLAKGAVFRFQATGFSMAPFIRDGDSVVIVPLRGRDLLGIPVAYVQPASGRLAIHRVIARRKKSYLIKGDNCSGIDGWIEEGRILGIVYGVKRGTKQVVFGFGPERYIIVFLSRANLLRFILCWLRCLPASVRRQFHQVFSFNLWVTFRRFNLQNVK